MDSDENEDDFMVDDLNDGDYEPSSDELISHDRDNAAPTSAGSTTEPMYDRQSDLYRRLGAKKALAPYFSQPLVLRNFLKESTETSATLEAGPLLAPLPVVSLKPADEDEQPRSARRRSDTVLKKTLRFFKPTDAAAADAARQDLVNFEELNNRVRRAAPSFLQAYLSVDQCLARAPNLQTLRNRKADQRVYSNHSSRIAFTRSLHSVPYVRDLAVRTGHPAAATAPTVIPQELRVTVRVFRGRPPMKQSEKNRNLKVPSVMYCLGSSPLSAIAQLISCPVDSQDTDGCADKFFVIEGTFFADDVFSPDTKAWHYHEWCKSENSVESRLQVMDGTTLQDIELRLGFPYLYKHGRIGCEHFVVFSDVRLLHAEDELDLTRYPRLISDLPALAPVCEICSGKSRWQVKNSKRLPQQVNYLCDACNELFNFNSAGALIEPELVLLPVVAGGRETFNLEQDDDE
ncbi:putative snRNA-activating protein complex subunit 3 [Hypsibius exemplaris]|uniref:snRNA-activating protein complex subunit 3 n=1 Tax=Hypsibius exemplaris TaxID=2072580 RepID=A0A1W0WQL1_HYPEX|nr:putative snRNA-activating protein complex subunit 3 [Hypsibius exemplaris]